MTVTEIQEAVMKLSTGEFKELLQWLDEFSESLWDRQIEEDLEAGKLDGLIQQARKEFRDGKYQEI
ncbi:MULTISPECIES: hypothetical protein [unclassified Roseofilum]|uniref:hypothetical protein n=1 Tax=unclassified Roseofilum TaxID=2620099 RepID=UPI001B2BCE50|nr:MULTISPECIES: hypothetical protein [unclassified Roseofilum]MBP0008726.1 hypothetical protein [Roseofilum sp. Belize Diploria]MBP0035611.1 hypothetical protein [Roseofilum sp. Belize BBD 4]